MSVIIILIAFSLAIAITFLIAFLWSVKTGQYDDNHTPAIRILFDDPLPKREGVDSLHNSPQELNQGEKE